MQIILFHTRDEIYTKSIAYTAYHIWEHLFIRILEDFLWISDIRISGMTTRNYTMLTLEGEWNGCSDNIIQRLEKQRVSKKWINVERNIILNELPCMECLYSINYFGCFDCLSYEQMNAFRREKYKWDNVIINNTIIEDRREECLNKKEGMVFHENAMDLMRERLIRKYKAGLAESGSSKSKDFFLFCYPLEETYGRESKGLFERLVYENDTARGYYQVFFKRRSPISIVTWPSLEKKNGKIWLVIFTFLERKFCDFFGEKNREFIEEWIRNEEGIENKIPYYNIYCTESE